MSFTVDKFFNKKKYPYVCFASRIAKENLAMEKNISLRNLLRSCDTPNVSKGGLYGSYESIVIRDQLLQVCFIFEKLTKTAKVQCCVGVVVSKSDTKLSWLVWVK